MKYKEFLDYLEENLEGYKTFMAKAMQYQHDKNAARQKSARWELLKMEKTATEMWKTGMQSLYNNLKKEINSDMRFSWISYIENNNILESVNEGISEMDFSAGA